ncbi:MAG TPA: hypothetical protein VM943_11725 [Pyrinomonadaceae bacterium]|nr:hypothetical protein [Pyrinomonadaceae bacterium]
MSSDKPSEKSWKPANTFFALLLLALVGYNLYSGLAVKKLGLPGLFEIEFGHTASGLASEKKVEEIGDSELKSRQAKLEQQVENLQTQVATKPLEHPSATSDAARRVISQASTAAAPARESFNLSGSWGSDEDGLSYVIQQSGNTLIVQETHSAFGITAAGQGQLVGQDIELSVTTVLGTTGRARLRVSDDGNRITGQVTDFTTGGVAPVSMYR